MSNLKQTINVITLTEFLKSEGLIQKIGGFHILSELNYSVPNTLYLEHYITLVNEKSLRRELLALAYKLINTSFSTNQTVKNIFPQIEQEFLNILNPIKSHSVISGSKLLNEIVEDIKKNFLTSEVIGLRSGLRKLDLLTQGFQRSDLIILAGRPSMGKTALSINIALNVMKDTMLPTIFFTLEMSRQQIMYRFLSLESNICAQKLKQGKLLENDWVQLNKVIKLFSKFPLFIHDSPTLSISQIRTVIQTIKFEQKKVGIVIIDYLQLIESPTNSEIDLNRVQSLSYITKNLKLLAREFQIPIIVLSQLNRKVENRMDQRPMLSDLKESGSIEQDADLVLMLSRMSNLSTQNDDFLLTQLIIAKQRNGPTGSIDLEFEKVTMKFDNPTNF